MKSLEILMSDALPGPAAPEPKNPPFPENRHGLTNGSYIVSAHPEVEAQLGVKVGEKIPVGWTGRYVRYRDLTWGVEQLCGEIDAGFWTLLPGERINFSDPARAFAFALSCS